MHGVRQGIANKWENGNEESTVFLQHEKAVLTFSWRKKNIKQTAQLWYQFIFSYTFASNKYPYKSDVYAISTCIFLIRNVWIELCGLWQLEYF